MLYERVACANKTAPVARRTVTWRYDRRMRPQLPEWKTLTSLGVVFGAIGVLLTIIGLALSLPRFYLVATGAVAEGTVIEIKVGSKNSKRAVVAFKPKGKPRTKVTATVGNSSATHVIGEPVQVYYDPSDPSDALIDSFLEVWFFTVLLNGMGVMWLAMGGPCLLVGRARRAARDRVRREGLRAQGVVVEVRPHRQKSSVRYEPIVEALDPITGAPSRFSGDQGDDGNVQGRAAMVYMEASAPHRYFVEV